MTPYDPTFETYRNAAILSQAAQQAQALHAATLLLLLLGSMIVITLLYYQRVKERRTMNKRLTRQAQSYRSEIQMVEARAVSAERALSQTRAQLSQFQPTSQPRPRPCPSTHQLQQAVRVHRMNPKTPLQQRVAGGWMTAQSKARFN